MRITKRQLKRIIKEEKAKLCEQPGQFMPDTQRIEDMLFEIFIEEFDSLGRPPSPEDFPLFRQAVMSALDQLAKGVTTGGYL